MKRIIALSVAILFLFCACSDKPEVPKLKTADMLDITNTDLDFQGCRSRFDAVISAMKSKVTVLENAHNETVKSNAESEYFLEKEYVLTAFEPFMLSDFGLTREFSPLLTAESANSVFAHKTDGMKLVYESDGKSSYVLQFLSETIVKEYSVEYSEKTDGFRYVYSVEDSGGERVEEFLEFIKDNNGRYLIQSNSGRCIVEFDAEDKIVYFCCGELNGGEFTLDESVFGDKNPQISENWVLERGKSNYINIHTYDSGMLTHEDCSSGPWKSVKISEEDYASAFYAHK